MGNNCDVCCGPDLRPVMKIKLTKGSNISREENDTSQAEAYVVFSFGNIKNNRFQTQKSTIKHCINGKCQWNEEFTFPIGSLQSTQSLLIELKDRDLVGSDKLGDIIIYHGNHPLNTKIPLLDRASNSKQLQTSDIKDKESYSHFLPMEWNEVTDYTLDMEDKKDGIGGHINLQITMVNRSLVE